MMRSLQGGQDQKPSRIYVEYENNGKTKSYPDFLKSRGGKKRGEMQVIHLDGFKGIRTNIKSHTDPFEIYDLKTDVGERKNLAKLGGKFKELDQRMRDQVLRLRIPNETARRPYDSEFIPGYQNENELKSSFDKCLEGKFNYVPDLTASKKEATSPSVVKKVVLSEKQTNFSGKFRCANGGAVMVVRTVEVTQSGRYSISLQSKSRVFVRLHEAGIIDADFDNERRKLSTEVELNLGEGFHPLLIAGLTGEKDELSFSVNFRRLGASAK